MAKKQKAPQAQSRKLSLRDGNPSGSYRTSSVRLTSFPIWFSILSLRLQPSSLLCRQLVEACGKFFVDASKTAVRKDGDNISAAKFGTDGFDDCVGIREEACWSAVLLDLRGERREFEALILGDGLGTENSGNDYFIGLRQTAGQIAL